MAVVAFPAAEAQGEALRGRHVAMGARLQSALRLVLAVFLLVTLAAEPPEGPALACYAAVGGYLLLATALAVALTRVPHERLANLLWLPLAVDLLALAGVTLLAAEAALQSWTAYIFVNGFFLMPMLAAAQLRPLVTVAVAVPTVGVFVLSSVVAREDNGEPWSSLLLRAAVLTAVLYAAVQLSRIQQRRVAEITELADARAALAAELSRLEDRQRRDLAESLHDGALQYLLAARLDLDSVEDDGDSEAFQRVRYALGEASRMLRSTVGQLHPAVLEHSGLAKLVV